jgi:hypothetical protein
MADPKPCIVSRHVAVDNVCAWPNLSVLPDGEVGALVFNRPSHGGVEGDVELWSSAGGEAPWERRSVVSRHEPGTVRMNVAGGVSRDGTVVALVSGWQIGSPRSIRTDNILAEVEVCLSSDAGRSWTRDGRFEPPAGSGRFMPFGKLVDTGDAWLAPAYDCRMSSADPASRRSSSWIFASSDGGRTWSARGTVGADFYTETDILPVSGGWIAAARTLQDYASPGDPRSSPCVRLMRGSSDAGAWTAGPGLTVAGQHPGHLLRLGDGRILFTCGSRVSGFLGVLARLSADEGGSWSAPLVLASDCLSSDQGYPSCVELPDGSILTAYYSRASAAHHRYHMATVRWRLE